MKQRLRRPPLQQPPDASWSCNWATVADSAAAAAADTPTRDSRWATRTLRKARKREPEQPSGFWRCRRPRSSADSWSDCC